MSSVSRDAFRPSDAVGPAALGLVLWRVSRALTASWTTESRESLASESPPSPSTESPVSTEPEPRGSDSLRLVNQSDYMAPVQPRPASSDPERGEREPAEDGTFHARPAAIAPALALVSNAQATHARLSAMLQASRLLVGDLVERARAAGDPATSATVESFNSAQVAAAELDAELARLLDAAAAMLATPASDTQAPPALLPAPSESAQPVVGDGVNEPQSDYVAELPWPLPELAVVAPAEEASEPVADEAEALMTGTSGPLTTAAHDAGDASRATSSWSRLDLQVSRFTNFADLNSYRDAISRVPGVRDVKIRRVHKGVLFLSVDYEGIIPLADRLHDIREHPPRRVSSNGDTIQVALTEEDSE